MPRYATAMLLQCNGILCYAVIRYTMLCRSCYAMLCYAMLCLTNRFHVAVRLFVNRSQMTSKCAKNKKVAHAAIAECVTDVLTTF